MKQDDGLRRMKESEDARNRFTNLLSTAMLVIFLCWNVWLGFGEPRGIDMAIMDAMPDFLTRRWTSLEEAYGAWFADAVFLFRNRVLFFAFFECALLYLLFRETRLSGAFLVPFPTRRENARSMTDQKFLKTYGAYTERGLPTKFYQFPLPHPFGTARSSSTGVRNMLHILIGVYLGAAIVCLSLPWNGAPARGDEGIATEEQVLLLAVSALFLVTIGPMFMVALLRKLLNDPDRG